MELGDVGKPCEAGNVLATPKTLCTVAPRIGNEHLQLTNALTSPTRLHQSRKRLDGHSTEPHHADAATVMRSSQI